MTTPLLARPAATEWIFWTLREALEAWPIGLDPSWRLLDEQGASAELRDGEIAMLVPSGGSGRAFALDDSARDLVSALTEPRALDLSGEPLYALLQLARLLADSVLTQVRPGRRNGFIDCLPPFEASTLAALAPRNVMLSARATDHALAWHDQIANLSRALYSWGGAPGYVPSEESFCTFCGLVDSSSGLERSSQDRPWLFWRAAERRERRSVGGYKLFIACDEPLEALFPLIRMLPELPIAAMKLPACRASFARPDHFVMYFSGLEDLVSTVEGLFPAVEELAGRGVPFASPIDAGGVLSWGIDPVLSEPDSMPRSHRSIVATRLAYHIDQACAGGGSSASSIMHEVAWRMVFDGYVSHGCEMLDGVEHVH